MTAYLLIEHTTGLSLDQWQALDSGVNMIDEIAVLHSFSRSPNHRIQLANKINVDGTRSVAGLDILPDAEAELSRNRQSPVAVEAKLEIAVQQAIRAAVQANIDGGLTGLAQNDFSVSVISTDTEDESASSGVQAWLATPANWTNR